MSILQQEVVRRVSDLSDEDARLLLEIISRLMSRNAKETTNVSDDAERKLRAFQSLESLRKKAPAGFDPKKELYEALEEKYDETDDAKGVLQ